MRLGRIFDRLGKKKEESPENAIIQYRRGTMIHKCAVKISEWCNKSLGDSEEERQVVQYGVEVILDTAVKAAVILLAGALTGKLLAFAAVTAVFCSLRYWAGGIHCKTSFRCQIAMLGICFISVYGAFLMEAAGKALLWFLTAACYLGMILLEQKKTKKGGFLPDYERKKKKIGAILWLTGELILIGFIGKLWWKWVLIIPIFIETITILLCKSGKERGHEKCKSSEGN